jgi:hypothetical protein
MAVPIAIQPNYDHCVGRARDVEFLPIGACANCMAKGALVTLLAIIVAGPTSILASSPAHAEYVYLYDGRTAMTKLTGDMVIWKSAADAQSANSRLFNNTNLPKAKCLARPGSRVQRLSASGAAFEVRYGTSCKGFINKSFVHEAK